MVQCPCQAGPALHHFSFSLVTNRVKADASVALMITEENAKEGKGRVFRDGIDAGLKLKTKGTHQWECIAEKLWFSCRSYIAAARVAMVLREGQSCNLEPKPTEHLQSGKRIYWTHLREKDILGH